ncbi:MAG: CHAT domain-containing protein [Beijerinckiaceae bacterium]|nr:CHAT domain-containing protein [Beijerinckiaceae bacterium]
MRERGQMDRLIAALACEGADAAALAAEFFDRAGRDQALRLGEMLVSGPDLAQRTDGLQVLLFLLHLRRLAFGSAHLSVAAILQRIATTHCAFGDPRAALPAINEAVSICVGLTDADEASTLRCLADLARIRLALGDHGGAGRAVAEVQACLARETPPKTESYVELLAITAALARAQGDFRTAKAAAADLLALCGQIHGKASPVSASAMIDLALTLHEADCDPAAISLCRSALAILRPATGAAHPRAVAALHVLGRVIMDRGGHGKALGLLREAHRLAKEWLGPDHCESLATLGSLADLTARSGPPIAAGPIYAWLIELKREALGPLHPEVADLLVRAATVDIRLGDSGQAELKLSEARAIQETVLDADHPAVARTRMALAELAIHDGRYAQARRGFEDALAIRKVRLGERHPLIVEALSGLARLHADLGALPEALALQSEAVARLTALHGEDHPALAGALALRARILAKAGDIDTAERHARRAVALRRVALGTALGSPQAELAAALCDLGAILAARRVPDDRAQAEIRSCIDEASGLVEAAFGDGHCGLVPVQIARASSWTRSADDGVATDCLVEAAILLAPHPAQEDDWLVWLRLGELKARAHDWPLAIMFGKRAINRLQRVRAGLADLEADLRKGYLRERSDAYRLLAGWLVAAGRLPEALFVRDLMKGAELREGLRAAAAWVPQAVLALTPSEALWWETADRLLADLGATLAAAEAVGGGVPYRAEHQARLSELRAARRHLTSQLRLWINDDRATCGRRAQASPIEMAAPPPGHAALSYLVLPDRLQIVADMAHGPLSRDLPIAAAALNDLVFSLWSQLRHRGAGVIEAGRRLHEILLAPIEAELDAAGVHHLTVSLDGGLRYIPFAVLHDGAGFTVQRFSISVAGTGARTSTRERPAASGDPVIAGFGMGRAARGLPALPHVASELAAVVRTPETPDGMVAGTIRLNQRFTDTSLRETLATEPDIVHIASHFCFLPGQEMASWLLLGDGETLSVERLVGGAYRLENIELVVLSACDTALATRGGTQGRELETLPAMFRACGVGSVLASLWPVDDGSTADLMKAFYRFWRLERYDKAKALRLAQLALMQDAGAVSAKRGLIDPDDDAMPDQASHPHQWAAFVLIEDGTLDKGEGRQ